MKPTLIVTGIATAALALSVNAATILSEDWQNGVEHDTKLDDTTTNHPGWEFTQGNGNFFRHRHHNDRQGGPQDGLTSNEFLHLERAGEYASYDTTHNWSASDEYTVSFNATELNWSNSADRRVAFRIREVVPGAETYGTTLYSGFADLPEYDESHAGPGNVWNANQFFTFDFSAADFTGGTEGAALSFEIGSEVPSQTYNRGLVVDNIEFTLVPIPEPATTALLTLCGLTLVLRRRR